MTFYNGKTFRVAFKTSLSTSSVLQKRPAHIQHMSKDLIGPRQGSHDKTLCHLYPRRCPGAWFVHFIYKRHCVYVKCNLIRINHDLSKNLQKEMDHPLKKVQIKIFNCLCNISYSVSWLVTILSNDHLNY